MKMKEKIFMCINGIKNKQGEIIRDTYRVDEFQEKEEREGMKLTYSLDDGYDISKDYYIHPKGWIVSMACLASVDAKAVKKAYNSLPKWLWDDMDYYDYDYEEDDEEKEV